MNLLDLARSALPAPPATPTLRPDAPVRCWKIHFPNLDLVEVIFAPDATRAEVAARYPGAQIEPLPASPWRAATPAEAVELRELIALILPDADDNERAYALRVALADPEAALTSFRALAVDLRPQSAPLVCDDRRTCRQCANLAAGRCRAAARAIRRHP